MRVIIKKSNITQENKKENQNYDFSLPVKKCSFNPVSDLQLVFSTISRDVAVPMERALSHWYILQ